MDRTLIFLGFSLGLLAGRLVRSPEGYVYLLHTMAMTCGLVLPADWEANALAALKKLSEVPSKNCEQGALAVGDSAHHT